MSSSRDDGGAGYPPPAVNDDIVSDTRRPASSYRGGAEDRPRRSSRDEPPRHYSSRGDDRRHYHSKDSYYGRGGGDSYNRRRDPVDDRRESRRRSPSRSPSRGRDTAESRKAGPPSRRRTDLSPSRERSRERERRRRKLQAECIRRAGGFKRLADSEGKEPVRLFWDGFQWVAKTGASSALLSDPILVNSTRKLRRLYFGNLPLHLNLTETTFQQIVFDEMRKRGLCNNPEENPVLCVWFAKDKGNYGFVEFASVEETERALTMDGMDCLGVAIKVSRPNDYCNATQAPTVLPVLAQQSAQLLATALPNLASGQLAAAIVAGGVAQIANSRLVLMKRMVQEGDAESSEDYQEILEDVKEGCEPCGAIVGCAIITPEIARSDPTFDSGDVYVMFETNQGADQCLAVMSERKYFERPIRAQKVASDIWTNRVHKVPGAVIIKCEGSH